MSLPKWLQTYLPSYDISKMNLSNSEDKEEIITQVLNYGDRMDILRLFRIYGSKEIKEVISRPRRGCWQERPLSYWTRIFNIKIPKIIYEVAIFSLRPRPELMTRYFKLRQKTNK